jgi:hypothetical protein
MIRAPGNAALFTHRPRTRYLYYARTSPVPPGVAADIRGRSYRIFADVTLTSDSRGVLFAHGSRFGGHALFIKQRQLYYVYNFLGTEPEQAFVSRPLRPGGHVLEVEFTRERAGRYGEAIGTTRLIVDDVLVAKGPMRTQTGHFVLCGEGLCVGYDSADSVSREYHSPAHFCDGTIHGVAVDVWEQGYLQPGRR